nr:YmjA family protein [Escherichia coli]
MLSALTPGANNEPRYPAKYYDIADEYATECAEPVADAERTPLAHYFQLLLTRLMNNEEISEEAQHEMAAEAGINPVRIDEIAEFLNQWGNE